MLVEVAENRVEWLALVLLLSIILVI